jgi:A/G-specific adenine glycosylase
MTTSFADKLLSWYAQNARELPWRGHTDPYAVWVSEVMLQQTRVETVIPYFERWMARFPSVDVLAAATQQEVLNLWEGLGYYSRARRLHRAAQILIAEHGGELPAEVDKLRALPGIGPYTAAAIASIAFNLDEAALDGNIRRVLARAFNVSEVISSGQGKRILWALAEEHLPSGRAGDYNQAMMDLGATVCTPGDPACNRCPLADICRARALGIQDQLPVKKAKPPIPHHTVTAAVIHRNGHILIAQRPQDGLLGGMWEFPGGKVEPDENLQGCLQREICEELGVDVEVGDSLGVYQHAYTHFRVTLHAFHCGLIRGEPRQFEHADLRWVSPGEFDAYPMGKLDRQIANALTK